MTSGGSLQALLRTDLAQAQLADGGFGFATARSGVEPAAEPTAVAALALDDQDARDWLLAHQAPSGGLPTFTGSVEDSSPAALVALALGRGRPEAQAALDYAIERRAQSVGESGQDANDGHRGWGWTPDAYSWVEPTARIMLAVRVLRSTATDVLDEAHAILVERQLPDGGWNYGKGAKAGVDPRGYLQTTAVALLALPRNDELAAVGLRFVEQRWADEPGGLSLAQALIAARLHDRRDLVVPLEQRLARTYAATRFLDNVLTLAWATLATAPDERLEPLRAAA